MDRQGFASPLIDSGPEAEAPRGLRAKNKAEKLQRIRKAARALFVKRGYDDTTMRDIAKRADVGFGTLFTYASDKRDMLFLIFNDELDNVVADSFARAVKERLFSISSLPFSAVSMSFSHRSRNCRASCCAK